MDGRLPGVKGGDHAHTCKSGTHNKRGADIKFYMDHVSWKGYTDHDWRDCPGCKKDYADRRAAQMGQHIKRDGNLVASTFETVDDFQRRRKCWNQQASRGGDKVIFSPFYQHNGSVVVVHTGDPEKVGGNMLTPNDYDRLPDMVYSWCVNPSDDKRNRASNGWGLDYAGTRGDGRKDSGDVYPVRIEGASTTRVASQAFGTENNSFGYGRKDHVNPADSYLMLLDWLHQERLEGIHLQIVDAFPQRPDNEVMNAIFNDERVQEAIKMYRLWEPEADPVKEPQKGEEKETIPQQTEIDFTAQKEPADIVLTWTGSRPAPNVEGVTYV